MGDKERMEQYRKEILEMVKGIRKKDNIEMLYGFSKALSDNEKRERGD